MNVCKTLVPLFVVALNLPAGNAVASSKALDGWGPYKFGMTPEQVVRAASGNIHPSLYGENSLETDVKMGPYDGMGTLFFSQLGHRLVRMRVETIGSTKDCKGSYTYFLKGLTQKYGHPAADRYGGYDWTFQNRYMINLSTGDHRCAVAEYFPRPAPPPKAGF